MYFQIADTNIRILGSLHMFPANAGELPIWILDAYQWSEEVFFEIDNSTVLPIFKSTSNTNLKTVLPSNIWNALESVWPTEGPMHPLNSINLWAALLLAPNFYQQCVPGVEPYLTKRVTEEKKPCNFLETAEELVTNFESLEEDEILNSLNLLVSDPLNPQRQLNEMYSAWIAKDLQKLYSVASKSPAFSSLKIRHAALRNRNKKWIQVIKKLLKSEKKILIVVGALHLVGPDNLLDLLNRKIELIPTGN